MTAAVYNVFRSSDGQTLPVVFDSPHSGRTYPEDFSYSCDEDSLIQAEDNHIDDLFDTVPNYGGLFLTADFPRTYIDVNRAEDDIDPKLMDTPCPTDINPTARSRAGTGLIRRLLRPGVPVYNRPLSWDEISHRVDNYYRPYHDKLQSLIKTAHNDFGQVWHINCHSMPSRLTHIRAVPAALNSLPDFVLGDRDGTSCGLDFRNAVRSFIENMGYSVAINDPYKGVEILRRYGNPAQGIHSLQVEINKRLYWDETKGCRSRNYGYLKNDLESLIAFISSYAQSSMNSLLAAD